MYVVVCADLKPGAQACQGMHALVEFSQIYTQTYNEWYSKSNYICMLAAPSEEALAELVMKAQDNYIRVTRFLEPDMENRLTAACFEPSEETKRLLSSLPLALKT